VPDDDADPDDDTAEKGRGPTDAGGAPVPPGADEVDDTPTVSCARCDRTWDLTYELDDLQVGNRALERFALDHRRHTGHFPDSVTPWLADCRHCPDEDAFLSAEPARRWAETHARHTRHEVTLASPTGESHTVEPE
jgi:hypothetical protein